MLDKKLKLHGFNNLTKTLGLNIYRLSYTEKEADWEQYLSYVNANFNSQRLARILSEVSNIIGATILNIATQDYEPQGSSVTIMVAEQGLDECSTHSPPPLSSKSLVAHLDKSHITAHTYPESHPHNGVSTLRVDIDVSTCGNVSPLKAIDYLIHSFAADIIIADYRVRGFSRDHYGRKHYIDHDINSIQDYLSEDVHKRYNMKDVNVYEENIFHTKMLIKQLNIENCLVSDANGRFGRKEQNNISHYLCQEMEEIFLGRNIE